MKTSVVNYLVPFLFAGIAAASSPANALVVTQGGYSATDNVPFVWDSLATDYATPIGGATRVLGIDDDSATAAINLGFSFSFFNQSYSQVYISSNGLISFGGGMTNSANSNLGNSITFSGSIVPFIAAAWDDWTTTYSGTDGVYYATLGNAGSQRFVVEWRDTKAYVPNSNSNSSPVTYEAVLYEGSNNIELRYLDMDTGGSTVQADASFGALATVGVRDINAGSNGRFLQWSNNQAVLENNTSILISHVPEPGTIALTLAGLGLIATTRRRKQIPV